MDMIKFNVLCFGVKVEVKIKWLKIWASTWIYPKNIYGNKMCIYGNKSGVYGSGYTIYGNILDVYGNKKVYMVVKRIYMVKLF